MRLVLSLVLAASTALASAQVKLGTHAQTLILTNINVVDTRHGTILPHMTVAVENGMIAAVGKVGLIGSTHNTQVINGSGKYLMPGLWDMHVNTASGPIAWDDRVILPLYIANGVTGIRDMGGDPAVLAQRRQRIASGDLLGPHMILAGPSLNGGKHDTQTIAVNTPEEARQAVHSVKSRGMDFIRISSGISPGVYWPLAEEAKKQHMRFAGQVPLGVSASEASQMGQSSIEQLSGMLLATSTREEELRAQLLEALSKQDTLAYSRTLGQAIDTYSQSKAWTLFSEFVDNNTWQVPTLVWELAQANMDRASVTHDPRTKYVPASLAKDWAAPVLLPPSSGEQMQQKKKCTTQFMKLVQLMHRAGVMIMAGTGSPDRYVIPGYSLHDELELLANSRLSASQALQAATLYPALYLTKLNLYGVVEKDHVADLVMLDGNPLEDIRNTRKISAVIVGGRYFGRVELDKMLQKVEDIARKQ